jgi:hypothetical protein
VHPHLPTSVTSRLVGFRFDGATVFPTLNLKWGDDACSKGLAGFVRDFVGRNQTRSISAAHAKNCTPLQRRRME